MMAHAIFGGPRKDHMSFEEVLNAINAFVKQDSLKQYKVIVGSDSSAPHKEPFSGPVVSVVIVWRLGNGATYFWMKGQPETFYTRRDRIIRETLSSIMLAQEIRSHLKKSLGDNFIWDGSEIHADIGEVGETREFIKEVVGMITGYNFMAVIKPDSFGASKVADRHTK